MKVSPYVAATAKYLGLLVAGGLICAALRSLDFLGLLVLLWLYATVPLLLSMTNVQSVFLSALTFGIGTTIGNEVMWYLWAKEHGNLSHPHYIVKFWAALIMIAIVAGFSLLARYIKRSNW